MFSERARSCPAQKPGSDSWLCRALRGWETSGSAAMEGSVPGTAGHQGRALPSLTPCQAPNAPAYSCISQLTPQRGVAVGFVGPSKTPPEKQQGCAAWVGAAGMGGAGSMEPLWDGSRWERGAAGPGLLCAAEGSTAGSRVQLGLCAARRWGSGGGGEAGPRS